MGRCLVAGGADSVAVLTSFCAALAFAEVATTMSWWNWQKMGGAVPKGDSSGLGRRMLFSQLEVCRADDLGSLTTCHTSTVLEVREDRGSVPSAPQPVQLQGLAFPSEALAACRRPQRTPGKGIIVIT